MKNKRVFAYVTVICVLVSATFFISGCVALWKNRDYAGGNHSFLFGTSWEGMLQNRLLISLVAAIPLFIPLFFRRNLLTICLCVCGVVLFLFMQSLLITLTD